MFRTGCIVSYDDYKKCLLVLAGKSATPKKLAAAISWTQKSLRKFILVCTASTQDSGK